MYGCNRLQAVHLRHLQIHQHDVRLTLSKAGDRLLTAPSEPLTSRFQISHGMLLNVLGRADHGWLRARFHFSFAGYHDRERMGPVIERAAAVFDHWTGQITQRLIADGIPAEQAGELSVLTTSALEGAIVLARVRRDVAPLDLIHRQLRNSLLTALQK